MEQNEVDVCETLLDLIDRVVFLSGEESCSRKFADRDLSDSLQDYIRTDRRALSSDSEDEDQYYRRQKEGWLN
jgi:hypothetical protein